MEMRIEIDKEADAAYIYFKEISPAEVKQTISLNDSINIDLDSEGKTIGIEILEASKNLPVSSLKSVKINN
jgi:uncharacterized protein YuzE